MRSLPELIAAFTFFGAFVICPLVYMLMKHQRGIAELIHRNASNEVLNRMAALEQEMRELKADRHAQIIRNDDLRELNSNP